MKLRNGLLGLLYKTSSTDILRVGMFGTEGKTTRIFLTGGAFRSQSFVNHFQLRLRKTWTKRAKKDSRFAHFADVKIMALARNPLLAKNAIAKGALLESVITNREETKEFSLKKGTTWVDYMEFVPQENSTTDESHDEQEKASEAKAPKQSDIEMRDGTDNAPHDHDPTALRAALADAAEEIMALPLGNGQSAQDVEMDIDM